jgi:hypothetical protein
MKNKLILLVLAVLMAASAQAVCNNCILQVIPVQNSVCQDDVIIYDLKITNVYDMPRAISLSAASDISLTSDMPSLINIGAYESETIRVTFTPQESVFGQHRISFISSTYGAEDRDDALFSINDCYSAGLQPGVGRIELCEDDVGRFDFTVTNTGSKTDTYSLSVGSIPDSIEVSFLGGRMTLAPGSSRTASITVRTKSGDYGEHPLTVSIASQHESLSKQVIVEIKNCYNTRLTAPESFTSCPDAGLVYTATLKNNGCVDNTYALSLAGNCTASIGQSSVTLAPGEEKRIAVTLSPSSQSCVATLRARSPYDDQSASTQVNIMACYGVNVDLIPPEQSACRGQPTSFDAIITNTGYYTDTYDLALIGMSIGLNPDRITLASRQSETIKIDITGTWCVIEEEIPFMVSARGKSSDSASAVFKLFSYEDARCASLDVHPAVDPISIDCAGGAYNFYVQNTGYNTQEVSLSLSGPGNFIMQPSSFSVRAGESRPVSLYLMPIQGMDIFKLTVIAETGYGRSYMELDVDFDKCRVSRPVLTVSPPQPLVPIITEPDEDAEDEPPESPTGAVAAGDSSLWALVGTLVITAFILLFAVLIAGNRKGKGPYFPEAKAAKRDDSPERLAAIKEAISKTQK